MENITGEINPKIYESPDGGITVTVRDFGEPYENRVIVTKLPVSDRDKDPIMQAIKKNSYFVDVELCGEHPELQTKWEEFRELQQHYQAWDILNKK